jgi:hypothetical protein
MDTLFDEIAGLFDEMLALFDAEGCQPWFVAPETKGRIYFKRVLWHRYASVHFLCCISAPVRVGLRRNLRRQKI